MDTVFDAPMTANRRGKAVDISLKTEQGIAGLVEISRPMRRSALTIPMPSDPSICLLDPDSSVSRSSMSQCQRIRAAHELFQSFQRIRFNTAKIIFLCEHKGILDVFIQIA